MEDKFCPEKRSIDAARVPRERNTGKPVNRRSSSDKKMMAISISFPLLPGSLPVEEQAQEFDDHLQNQQGCSNWY
jgi:hypothetical protein